MTAWGQEKQNQEMSLGASQTRYTISCGLWKAKPRDVIVETVSAWARLSYTYFSITHDDRCHGAQSSSNKSLIHLGALVFAEVLSTAQNEVFQTSPEAVSQRDWLIL